MKGSRNINKSLTSFTQKETTTHPISLSNTEFGLNVSKNMDSSSNMQQTVSNVNMQVENVYQIEKNININLQNSFSGLSMMFKSKAISKRQLRNQIRKKQNMHKIFNACTEALHKQLKEAIQNGDDIDPKQFKSEIVTDPRILKKPIDRSNQLQKVKNVTSCKSQPRITEKITHEPSEVEKQEKLLNRYMSRREAELKHKQIERQQQKQNKKLRKVAKVEQRHNRQQKSTSLVDLKSMMIKGPKKNKKRKPKLHEYDVFSETSESDEMDQPPKYIPFPRLKSTNPKNKKVSYKLGMI